MTPGTELAAMVRALVPDWRADALGAFEYLSGGYSNENYRFTYAGEAFVLRVPSRIRPFVDRAHEAAFYDGEHRVRIPTLVAFDPVTGNMISRYEPGELLTDTAAQPAELVRYLEGLHAGLPPSGRRYDPVRLAREYLASGTPPGWIEDLATGLVWRPFVSTPCHNDLNPWNVIVPATGAWVTLDWEWYGENDPLFDLVTLHQGLGLDDAALARMLSLWSGEPVAEWRLVGCLRAFWLREYAWAHAEWEHGNRRPEIGEQLDLAAGRLADLQSGTSSG
ncbi:MAG: phosphotransferase [Pseudomonadales bacterium]